MSFAESLRQVRKEKGLSQEELADLIGVSRQAVSKWEQGAGYPETEKLLRVSQVLDISLDSLMSVGTGEKSADRYTGRITITSPHENVIATCYKVMSSQKFKAGKGAPEYALFGVSEGSRWGESKVFLGWYANKNDVEQEISGIMDAIAKGRQSFQLKHSVKTERRGLKVKIVEDRSAVHLHR